MGQIITKDSPLYTAPLEVPVEEMQPISEACIVTQEVFSDCINVSSNYADNCITISATTHSLIIDSSYQDVEVPCFQVYAEFVGGNAIDIDTYYENTTYFFEWTNKGSHGAGVYHVRASFGNGSVGLTSNGFYWITPPYDDSDVFKQLEVWFVNVVGERCVSTSYTGTIEPSGALTIFNLQTSDAEGIAVAQLGLATAGSTIFVDWGDGTGGTITNEEVSHTYPTYGVYTCKVKVTDGLSNGMQLGVNVVAVSNISPNWDWFDNMFDGSVLLTEIASGFPTQATSANNMFNGCILFNDPNTNSWDVSNLTSSRNMFSGCVEFNGQVSSWDVSNIVDMYSMFKGCVTFVGNLSTWTPDVNKVGTFMFQDCIVFNSQLSEWDVTALETAGGMFDGCQSFTSDLSTWDVSALHTANFMFRSCHNFESDLSTWQPAPLTYVFEMFKSCLKFNSEFSNWNFANLYHTNSLEEMFSGCLLFDGDLSDWNVSTVTDHTDFAQNTLIEFKDGSCIGSQTCIDNPTTDCCFDYLPHWI